MNTALSVYATCVVVLFFKMVAVSCYQGYFRIRLTAFTNPEDAAFFNRAANATELPEVARGAKVWLNDLENIPVFIALAGLAIVVQAPAAPTVWLCGVFTAARVVHTLAYLARVQPWRTVSYGVGVVCLVGLAGVVMVGAWGG